VPAVKDRFSVARCCCEQFCEDCCNGNAPTEWDVDIQYTDEACSACNEEASGVFTLARTGGICRWFFRRNKSSGWNPACVADYTTYGNEFIWQDVTLEVRCINEQQYRITAWTFVESQYATGSEINQAVTAVFPFGAAVQTRNLRRGLACIYSTVIDFDDFTCDEEVDFELPLISAQVFLQLEYYFPDPPFFSGWFNSGLIIRNFTSTPIPTQTYTMVQFFGPTFNIDVLCQPPATIKITGVP
jgi:hypothetical protein